MPLSQSPTTHRWLWSRWPFQPFFVIATCRSGSNLLLSYLWQHKVTMLAEVLCHLSPDGPKEQLKAPEDAVRHVRHCLERGTRNVRGCKLMLYQLEAANLTMDRLDSEFPGAKYIILYRQNVAEQYVSHRKAFATKQYALRDGAEKRDASVHVDPAGLRGYCETMRSGYSKVLNHPWLRDRGILLSYEELVADPNEVLRRICTLLGVKQVAATTKMRKQNDQPLEASISNYSEVAAMLPDCKQRHEWPRRMAA